jgi:FMN phosphatase YigB (HAD superfamily)
VDIDRPVIGLLAAGGFQGIPYLELIHRIPNATSVVLDSFKLNVNFPMADRYVYVPPFKEEGIFLENLREIIRTHDISFLFPTTQLGQAILADLREFEKDTTYVVSCKAILEILLDKARLIHWLCENGFPALHGLDPIASTIPLIGKPRMGWGTRGIVRLAPGAQLPADVIAQDYLWQRDVAAFRELSIDTGISLGNSIVKPIVRERIQVSGGFAVVSHITENLEVENLATALLVRLAEYGALGPFNIQVLVEPDGIFWISDINPRLGTSAITIEESRRNIIEEIVRPKISTYAGSSKNAYVFRSLVTHSVQRLDSSIQGVVFDLDNTLLDQKKWIRTKLESMEDLIVDEYEVDRLKYQFAVNLLVDEGPWNTLVDQLINEIGLPMSSRLRLIEAYRHAQPRQAPLYRDVLPVLKYLRRSKLKLGILTDNPPASQRQKLSVSPLPEFVDAVIMTDELGSSKPKREGFHAIADALALPPGNVVMVGDNMMRDIVGALGAGFRHGILVERRGAMFSTSEETKKRMLSILPDRSFSVVPQLSFLRAMFQAS